MVEAPPTKKMKILRWFETGEPIPMDSEHMKTETRTETTWDADGTCRSVSRDYHLYPGDICKDDYVEFVEARRKK